MAVSITELLKCCVEFIWRYWISGDRERILNIYGVQLDLDRGVIEQLAIMVIPGFEPLLFASKAFKDVK